MRKIFKRLFKIISIMIIFTFLFSWLTPWIFIHIINRPYSIEYSPDRLYKIEYHAIPFKPFKAHYFIGIGCSDCPVYLCLIENKTNATLHSKYDMIQSIGDSPIWEKDNVYIPRIAHWRFKK